MKKVNEFERAIWIGLVEIRPLPGCQLLGRSPGAFTNIITWARNATEYGEQVATLARAYSLFVAGVENARTVASGDFSTLVEELEILVRQAEEDPQAILLGTLHTYAVDEA